jgi:nucleoside-diphosphate-sugar epimerase
MRKVLITGTGGNLGGKLVHTFAKVPWCEKVVAVARPSSFADGRFANIEKVEPLPLELTSASDGEIGEAVALADTIVHFAVVNALPDATWEEAASSFMMTSRLLFAARDRGLKRFVFASSNHAVGALKEVHETLAPGSLTAERVAPGTHWETLDGCMIGYGYGSAKIFTERMCVAAAQRDGLSTVSIRIGWCQVGENLPHTLNAGGNPKLSADKQESKSSNSDLRWFRNMWLSNRDFDNLFERAVLADAANWPQPGIVINGVSANSGMAWEIETAKQLIGYRPQDDVWS